MKTFSKSGFAVTALLLTVVVACANSADVAPVEEAQPTDPAPAAKIPPSQPSTTKTCVASCTTDAECQTSCPALAGGVQCCDTLSKTCRGSQTSACPTPPVDAGPDPAPTY